MHEPHEAEETSERPETTGVMTSNAPNTKRFQIIVELIVTQNEDGTITFTHDPIEIEGNSLVIAPALCFESLEKGKIEQKQDFI